MKARMKDFNEWILYSMCVCAFSIGLVTTLVRAGYNSPTLFQTFSLSLFSKSVALPAARGTELNYSWMQHRKKVKPFSHSGFSFMHSGTTQPFHAWHSGTLISGCHKFFILYLLLQYASKPTFHAWPQPLKEDLNKTASLSSYSLQMVLMDLFQNIVSWHLRERPSQVKLK